MFNLFLYLWHTAYLCFKTFHLHNTKDHYFSCYKLGGVNYFSTLRRGLSVRFHFISSFFAAHFDAKGRIEELIQRNLPSTMDWTIVRMSFYFNNFLTSSKPMIGSDGTRMVAIPMRNVPLPGIDVRDVGRCVVSKYEGSLDRTG